MNTRGGVPSWKPVSMAAVITAHGCKLPGQPDFSEPQALFTLRAAVIAKQGGGVGQGRYYSRRWNPVSSHLNAPGPS